MIVELLCAAYVSLLLPNADIACQNMEHLVQVAERNDLEPAVLVSLIYVESRWTPDAVSRDGACGLSQVLPKYSAGYRNRFGERLTCRQLKDPKNSISRGAKILAYYLKKYRKYKRGLCAYNAGWTRCKRTSSRNKGHRYAKKVLKISRKLKREMRRIELEEYTPENTPGCYE
tara:strand:+ start:3697 stop:4215 length:519 start_codon:yes stop_codon:yes gene_type:complete